MGAVHTLLKKTVLLLPLAVFAVSPVIQAQPLFNPISPQTITSASGLNVPVTSTDGSAIAFTASIDSTTVPSGPAYIWLTVSANGPTPGTVTVTPSELRNLSGVFTAVIRLTATAPAGVPSITFTASFTGGLSVAPASLVFTSQGTDFRSVSRQDVAFTGPPGTPWTAIATTTDNGGWLSISTLLSSLAADGAGTTQVQINPAGLVTGTTYTGRVTIVFSNIGSVNIAVTLSVQASPTLVSTPGSAIFNFHTGDPALQPVTISLAASDGSAVSATAASTTPWISVSQQAGSAAFTVSADPSDLGTGLYSGSVTVTSGLANSPMTIPLVLIVNGGSTTANGPLTFSPNSLSFSILAGSIPNAQPLTVSAAAATSFSVSTSVQNELFNWLNVNSGLFATGTTDTSISVSVSSAPLAVGLYTGTLTFTAGGVNQTVQVTLNVTSPGGGGGSVTVSPPQLFFFGQAGVGSTILSPQKMSITNAASAVNFTVTTSGDSWFSTDVQSGTTPLALTVNVDITGLSVDTYNGNVIITPDGGSPVTVPITLTVTAPGVSATPTSLTFTYRAGDSPPASQPVSVTGVGAGLSFTATASSDGNWLVVSPASGPTPATVNVSIDPANLAKLNASPTPYAGTITVSGSDSATDSTTITVSLTVTTPLLTVAAVTNAGSFAAGSISPGEIITLFGTNIGPAAQAVLALDTAGNVSTTIGGVQVLVNGFACPMVFASALQVSAVVPYELAGFTSADILVKFLGQTSNAVHVNVATTAPGLFTANDSGTGPGAILNGNNTAASPSFNAPNNPAAKGDIVAVYLTGEGQTSPRGVTGRVTTVSANPPLTPAPLLPVSVLIGPPGAQQPANFTFAGEAPELVSGVMQLNVQIPLTLTASGEVPIVVSIGGNPSQAGVTVSVK